MSIDTWAQVAILLACGLGVVVVNCLGQVAMCLGQVVFWLELPVERRLCPIFMSGVGLPDIHKYSVG